MSVLVTYELSRGVLVNCILFLAKVLNTHSVFVHTVLKNQSDKTFWAYFVIAQNCRVEKLQTPGSISLQLKMRNFPGTKMIVGIRLNQGYKTYPNGSAFPCFWHEPA